MEQSQLFGEDALNETLFDVGAHIKNLSTTPCHDCRLGQAFPINRSLVYKGSINSKIAAVSKAPTEKEMEAGRPMLGPSGQEFDRWMSRIGLSTIADLFTVNVVQCTPPRDAKTGRIRDPRPKKEIDRCFPRVQAVLNAMPHLKAILIIGSLASSVLLPGWASRSESSMHGSWFESPIFPGKALFYLPQPADFLSLTVDHFKYGRLFENLDSFKREFLNSNKAVSMLAAQAAANPEPVHNNETAPW